MNSAVLLLGLIAFAAGAAPLLYANGPNVVPGQYIVVFKANVTKATREKHIDLQGVIAMHTYEIGDFTGYAAKLTPQQLRSVRNAAEVDYVEADQIMRVAQCATQTGATWGINRISERAINLNGNYRYPTKAGEGVTAYIIDTGIYVRHTDFGTRATWGTNTVNDGKNDDCNGHGTHVAGTVGGTKYGVAKKVTLVAVKVLGCDGGGTNAGVIAGVNWATNQSKRPAVANMSLGGGVSSALDTAVANSIKAGITYALAAGNENADACNSSPARTSTAITVGATTVDDSSANEIDERASFSNWGTCVTCLAPGELITSAWIGSTSATKTISGTSMASPHVCGVTAVYMSNNPSATPASVKSWVQSQASSNYVSLVCSSSTSQCKNTPNKLLYQPCA